MKCRQAGSLSMDLPRQESWSGLPPSSPGSLPNPVIKPASLASPELADGFFITEPPGKVIQRAGWWKGKFVVFWMLADG